MTWKIQSSIDWFSSLLSFTSISLEYFRKSTPCKVHVLGHITHRLMAEYPYTHARAPHTHHKQSTWGTHTTHRIHTVLLGLRLTFLSASCTSSSSKLASMCPTASSKKRSASSVMLRSLKSRSRKSSSCAHREVAREGEAGRE